MRERNRIELLLLTGLLLAGLRPSPVNAQDKAAAPLFEVKDSLTEKEPFDKFLLERAKKECRHKVHEFEMKEGQTYRIDLKSNDFDAFLRVETPDGKMTGLDDDSGGNSNARLAFTAKKSGPHRLIVTTFKPGETGKYHLTVGEPSKLDLLTGSITQFMTLSNDERAKTLQKLVSHYEELGGKIGMEDAGLAYKVGFALEGTKMPGAADWFTKLSKALAQSDNERVKKVAKTMEGSARRIRLPGNAIVVKGPLLDGKEIDWSSYRGKVVLVDFWATWCGPCIAELPNVKKLYEAYKDKGFDVVGISLDRDGEAPAKFMEKRKLDWACIFDKEQPLADYYGVTGIPLAILVDKQGRVVSLNARGPELGRLLEAQLGPIEEKKSETN